MKKLAAELFICVLSLIPLAVGSEIVDHIVGYQLGFIRIFAIYFSTYFSIVLAYFIMKGFHTKKETAGETK